MYFIAIFEQLGTTGLRNFEGHRDEEFGMRLSRLTRDRDRRASFELEPLPSCPASILVSLYLHLTIRQPFDAA